MPTFPLVSNRGAASTALQHDFSGSKGHQWTLNTGKQVMELREGAMKRVCYRGYSAA